jgi:hypothetical protein
MDLYRQLLRLYPKSFRAEYSDAMRQNHADLRVHGGRRGMRLFASTAGDVLRSAPRLRWEAAVADHPGRAKGIVTILVAIAFIGLTFFGPILGVPLLLGLVVYMRRHADDLGPAGQSRALWIGLPTVGVALIVVGALGVAINTGDDWHPLAVLPLAAGFTTLVVSLVLMAMHEVSVRLVHRPPLVPGRTRALGAGLALGAFAILLIAMGEDGGWLLFMAIVISFITIAVLAFYALLLRFTRPRDAAAV